MSDPKRGMAREGLIRYLADMNGYDRHRLSRHVRDALMGRGERQVPNEFQSTQALWKWTVPEWSDMFAVSGDMRRRELRRKVERHRADKKESRKKKKAAYMRGYMKRYRARKSIDDNEGD